MGVAGIFRGAGGSRTWRAVLGAASVVCLAAGASGYAQNASPKTMLVEPPAPLLPAALGNLKRVAEGDSGDGLSAVAPADAATLKEDGLRRYAASDYAAAGRPEATVTIYTFGDTSGAISAYDFFRQPGMRPEKLGDHSVSKGDELLLESGANVVRANFKGGREAMAALTKELIVGLPKVSGSAGAAPLLPTLLPARGLDADSVKYALGPEGYSAMGGALPSNVVGFDQSAETVTAKYRGGGVLTLLLYPTPEIAGAHGRAIDAALKQEGSGAGTVKLRREGPLLAVTTGAWAPAAAQAMVDGVHLHSEVSFDKPMPVEFHAEVQKTYSLLESIVIFCGFSAVAMLVIGLFFGGGRALIRVMQGKPAATEPEFLHIDLRGPAGKRLGDRDDGSGA